MSRNTKRAQQGFTLIEALVAFGVTATGFLAVVSLQGALVTDSAYSKARSEAMSLAQQKIEEFKHYTLADETAYIDNDANGVMDPDGNYSDPAINGQNAVFTRSWQLSSATRGRGVDVTVAWADSANRTQSVFLAAVIPWISPRSGADQLYEPSPTLLNSPTGRAELGEGELSDYPNVNPVPVSGPGPEGLRTFQNEENLLLVDQNDHVLLTLLDVCNLSTDECTDFVKISGTVYFDTTNTNQPAVETYIIASDAAHCQRWVPSGTLTSPPSTATGSYNYYNYTCYLGGGWHGNLGFVTAPGSLLQTDKICQGDPTSLNAWEEPVIALRRAYRGMLQRTVGGVTFYESHGIKDATQLGGQDFVFTALASTQTAGSFCEGFNQPMTRTDSSFGALFTGTPTDFVCLNEDNDGDGNPDYLDNYDTQRYTAATYCPYDPTDPPVSAHTISGSVAILTATAPAINTIEARTSDGPGNCSWSTVFASFGPNTYIANYQCIVYDWGSGWTGYVQVNPLTNQIYCPNDTASMTAITSSQTRNFFCVSTDTVRIQGTIFVGNNAEPITAMVITNVATGATGYCNLSVDEYRCSLPYEGAYVDFEVIATTTSVVCGAPGNEFTVSGATAGASPYLQDLFVARNLARCP